MGLPPIETMAFAEKSFGGHTGFKRSGPAQVFHSPSRDRPFHPGGGSTRIAGPGMVAFLTTFVGSVARGGTRATIKSSVSGLPRCDQPSALALTLSSAA